jgi:hypothetical protein
MALDDFEEGKAYLCMEKTTASGHMGSFRQNPSELGPERLMAATRWFEKIPNTGAVPILDEQKVQELANKMGGLAKELGLGDLAGRYAGAVKNISRETRAQQIERLVTQVRSLLSRAIPKTNLVPHVGSAYGFRGVAAHAGLNADSDEEFSRFSKAIYAIECLCYLLTVCSLPLTDSGKQNLAESPRVREFEHSYVVDASGNEIRE